MPSSEIVIVGSLNTDLVATVKRFPEAGETLQGTDFKVYCGGKGANQAFAAARLGGRVAMVGQVGVDDFGTAQINNLASVHVSTEAILRTPNYPTGTAIIGIEDSGENRIIYIPGANGVFEVSHLRQAKDLLLQAKLILLQLEIPMETVGEALRIGRMGGARILLDPAPAAPIPNEWFSAIDFLTPNLGELRFLTGDDLNEETPLEQIVKSARTLCNKGVECVVAKLGSRGAVHVTADTHHHWPAVKVEAVDTTAAGDCFNAAFAVELAEGHSVMVAGERAVWAASCSVTRKGAQASMPTCEERQAFMERFRGMAMK